jgi:indole-3-glycerol phosphate synthase
MAQSTADFLDRIMSRKKRQVAQRQRAVPLAAVREKAVGRRDYRPFFKTLSTPGPSGVNILAEIKRASPSKGPLRPGLDAAVLAGQYERGGAAALSVLTETDFFMGADQDLTAARQATDLPVLRKDFIFSEYQVYESAAMGADAILLIVRLLSPTRLLDLLGCCRRLGMDALVEVFGPDDMRIAAAAGAGLIGINNRDLASFHTDTGHAGRLAAGLGPGQIAVAASGIGGRRDILAGLDAGITNFLVGEHLVRAPDPVAALRGLMGLGDGAKGR